MYFCIDGFTISRRIKELFSIEKKYVGYPGNDIGITGIVPFSFTIKTILNMIVMYIVEAFDMVDNCITTRTWVYPEHQKQEAEEMFRAQNEAYASRFSRYTDISQLRIIDSVNMNGEDGESYKEFVKDIPVALRKRFDQYFEHFSNHVFSKLSTRFGDVLRDKIVKQLFLRSQ